jgi:cell division protein FtsL
MAVPARRLDEAVRRRPAVQRRTTRTARGRVPTRRPAPRGGTRDRETGRVPFLLFSLLVVGALLIGLAAGHALVAQGSLRLDELQRRAEELRQDQDRLRVQLAERSSPERIIRSARRQGLVLPDRVEILAVRGRGVTSSPRHTGTLAGAVLGGEG